MENVLYEFNKFTDALIKCSFILSSKTNSDLLKVISKSEVFSEVISRVIKDFSYSLEFERACIPISLENNNNKIQLLLPKEQDRLFTFVTCLLIEFDTGKRDAFQFFGDFYPAKNIQDSYELFCKNVIVPFKEAGNYLYQYSGKNILNENLNNECFYSDIVLTNEDYEQLTYAFNEFKNLKFKIVGLDEQEWKLMLTALQKSINMKNAELIGLFYLSCKNILRINHINENQYKEFKNLLLAKKII